jgi:ketosteroid isomerase-like protein
MKEWQTMKPFMRLSAAFLAITLCSLAAEPSTAVKEAVMNAEQAWKTAVLRADGSALQNLLSDDLSYTHSSAKTQTKGEFIQDVTGGTTVYKSIEFENTRLRQYGSVVVITHSAVITTVQTGTTHLYLLEVWAQQEGRWLMVSRLATKLPGDAAPK